MVASYTKGAFIIQVAVMRSKVTFFLRETLANKGDRKITNFRLKTHKIGLY